MSDSLERWRDARQGVDAAIQSYLKSLHALGSDFHSHLRAINAGALENIALEVQEDLVAMDSRQERLTEGKRVLGGMLNKSPSLVPFSKIPNEVLLEIFRLSAWKVTSRRISYFDSWLRSDRHYGFFELLPLTHVCVNWRRLITATPFFWEYVDMYHFNIFKHINAAHCVGIVLERSADHPLSFDVDFGYSSEDEDEDFDRSIPSAVKILLPHMHRLQSVYLGYYKHSADVIEFLSLWLNITSAPTVPTHTLAVWRHPDSEGLYEDEILVYDPSVHQTSDSILLPIRVLRLVGFTFKWNSPAYRNLVHLHISELPPHASPTIDEVIGVLAACPDLQILQLTNIWLHGSQRNQLQPVILNHLKVLDLNFLYGDGMALLLPLLVIPPTNPLSFRLSLFPPSHESGSEALAFLARSNVYRLSIAAFDFENFLGDYLSVVKNVATLILELETYDGDRVLSAMTQVPPSRCPKFHTLYLIGGRFTEGSMRELIERHSSITKLRVAGCFMEPEVGVMLGVQKFRYLIPDIKSISNDREDINTRWYDLLT